MAALGSSAVLDTTDKQNLAAVQERASKERQEHFAENVAGSLEAQLAEHGVEAKDWNTQPRFAAARVAWRSGYTEDAKILTQQAIDQVDPEARAQQLFQEHLKKAGKVDTGETTAVGSAYQSYIQSLKSGGPLPSAEEIDRIVAQRMSQRS